VGFRHGPGEELQDLPPVQAGAGFRFEQSYTVTDLRTLNWAPYHGGPGLASLRI